MADEMEPVLPSEGFDSFEFNMFSHAMDPSLAGTSFPDDDFGTTSNATGGTMGPLMADGMLSNTMEIEQTVSAANLKWPGLSMTMSIPMGESSVNNELQVLESCSWVNATQPVLACSQLQAPETEPSVVDTAIQEVGLAETSLSRPADRSKWASKDDWICVRPSIKRLYVDKGTPLEDVMATVEKEHGLKATPKMYKDRIKKWGFDKNKKEPEMAAILRKKTQRDGIGKRSVFKVRGRVVDFDEVRHYFRRKGIALDKMSARHVGASTPPGISCTTPPLSPRFTIDVPRSLSMPYSLAVPEQLIFYIDRYLTVSFKNQYWVAVDYRICINSTSRGQTEDLRHFYSFCLLSQSFFRQKLFVEGRRALSKACDLVPRIIKEEHPGTMGNLLRIYISLIAGSLTEVVTQLRFFISRMAEVLVDADQPWGQICRLLGRINHNQLKDTLGQCLKCTHKIYVQCLGRVHPLSVFTEVDLIWSCSRDGSVVLIERRLRELLVRCEDATGLVSRSSSTVIMFLLATLHHQAKYAEAESIAQKFINNALETANYLAQTMGHVFIAGAQYKKGKLDLAENNMTKAIELLGRLWACSDPTLLSIAARLQSQLQAWGFDQRAAELGVQIKQNMVLAEVDSEDMGMESPQQFMPSL